jgi:hypothetical protein
MTKNEEETPLRTPERFFHQTQPTLGRLKKSDKPGEILVEVRGYEAKPARVTAGISRKKLLDNAGEGREVLVVFVDGNPDEPVIVAMMENVLEEMVFMESSPAGVRIDDERVEIRADKEIVLCCGEGSITLKKDGRIVVKGKELLSRATGVNKIKGAHVELN